MFTGIIEGTGIIKKIEGNVFTLTHPFGENFAVGESVACNGCCLTVLTSSKTSFQAEIMAESRRLTVFGAAQVGDLVNLERSAVIGQRNSGHNVTGHIDQLGAVLKLERQEDYWLIRVEVEPTNRKFLVHKGSVALNGISLTVSGVSDLSSVKPSPDPSQRAGGIADWFEVSIISHTWDVTNLNTLKVGDGVNVEFDVLGKYGGLPNDFDVWNEQKKTLGTTEKVLYFKEREVFFMRMGKNVGFEQDGRGLNFLRPAVVLKKFNRRFFWGVPLTTQEPKSDNPYYLYVGVIEGKKNWAILSQGKAFDAVRISHRLGSISKTTKSALIEALHNILF